MSFSKNGKKVGTYKYEWYQQPYFIASQKATPG